MYKYKIQSIIICPDGWFFDATTAKTMSDKLTFICSHDHHDTQQIVVYECEAERIDQAWRKFYKEVAEFVEATAFYTTSYLAFHDWNHIIVNKTKKLALLSSFERTFGTPLGLYSQDIVNEVHKVMGLAEKDIRLKKFLHCYRMAIMVDAPETHDAYEKYLILACEALAGEIEVPVSKLWHSLRWIPFVTSKTRLKYDTERLKQIMGKELHKYFFSNVSSTAKKTIRNANMHDGKSPNEKPSQTIRLVNKLREFVAKEYGLQHLAIIKEENSPTRGLYRDDGGLILVKGVGVSRLSLKDITDLHEFLKNKPDGITIMGGEEANALFKGM